MSDPMERTCSHGRYPEEGCAECAATPPGPIGRDPYFDDIDPDDPAVARPGAPVKNRTLEEELRALAETARRRIFVMSSDAVELCDWAADDIEACRALLKGADYNLRKSRAQNRELRRLLGNCIAANDAPDLDGSMWVKAIADARRFLAGEEAHEDSN